MPNGQREPPDAVVAAEMLLVALRKDGFLHHEQAVFLIVERFGESAVAVNDAGNYVIPANVLSEFRSRTEDIAVWDRSSRMWRMRQRGDASGRLVIS